MTEQTETPRPKPCELREQAMQHLAKSNYATSHHPQNDDGVFTVYIRKGQDAGGELRSMLGYFGYAPVYPKPHDGDPFVMEVVCEPANWHNWDEPNYEFIEDNFDHITLPEGNHEG